MSDIIKITGTKNREETLGLIAKTWREAGIDSVIEITQPNDRGGKSLEKMILQYFPNAGTDSYNKSRVISIIKNMDEPNIIQNWIKHTQLQLVEETGFYSMPGLFGWNKIDAGSKILLETITDLKGIGTDFGCGYGYLSKNILNDYPAIEKLYGFDCDPRAIEASRKNISDERGVFDVMDCTKPIADIEPLDFIITNPPFHDEAGENRTLGQRFIETASKSLKKGGALWLVANTHMPYEKTLSNHFSSVETVTQKDGFKIFHALK